MASRSQWLRIAVVQFPPKLGEVQANIAKARELCRGLTPRSVDLVCFPEMIFTGYMFPDAPSIAPFLEHPKTGPTATFCAELAHRLDCLVVAGFPERLDVSHSPTTDSEAGAVPLVGANAALMYDSTPALLHTYHKTNLFPTDQTWARPSVCGFSAVDLGGPFGRTAVAICNDLNVDERGGVGWVSLEEGPYELAGWCRREGVRVLVLLNAWLKPEDDEIEGVGEGGGVGVDEDEDRDKDKDAEDVNGTAEEGDGMEPNWGVLNYWALRLRPLWAPLTDVAGGTRQSETAHASEEEQEVIVVVCNRFGHERGKTFAGSSAMFAMRPGSGRPRLLQFMGEREEGVRIWTARVGSSESS